MEERTTIEDVKYWLQSATYYDLKKVQREFNKRLKNTKPQKVKPLAVFPQEALDTSAWLWSQVKERYPFLKEPDLDNWTDDIYKINRLDGHTWELIKMVCYWSQHDSFWRQQIRSGANLRKHFEKMMVRVIEENKTKVGVHKI